MSSNSSFCFGKVFHKRFHPREHAFTYRMFMPLLDLDDLSSSDPLFPKWLSGLVGINKHRLYAFFEKDYFKTSRKAKPRESLKTRVQTHIEKTFQVDLKEAHVKVLVLTQWRFFGVLFNPISVYYVLVNGEYRYLLAEVSNTPWRERKIYAYALTENGKRETWQDDKAFHVSPFNPMDMQYDWGSQIDEHKVGLSLTLTKQAQLHFTASFHYDRLAFTPRNFMKGMIAKPFFSMHTVWGIYWQALKLMIKRIPFYDHPALHKHVVSADETYIKD